MSKTVALIEKITRWIGSTSSLIVHSLIFCFVFISGAIHLLPWDSALLILTTMVSLEAIYLAIFLQMSVNETKESLRAVESDVDEIQEDVGEIQEDVDEIQKDIDAIQEEVPEAT